MTILVACVLLTGLTGCSLTGEPKVEYRTQYEQVICPHTPPTRLCPHRPDPPAQGAHPYVWQEFAARLWNWGECLRHRDDDWQRLYTDCIDPK